MTRTIRPRDARAISAAIVALSAVACSSASIEDEGATQSAAANGTSTITTRINGKCLDVNRSGTADGTKLQEWTCNGTGAQIFRVDDIGGGNSRIVNPQSGKCVDVNGGGSADGTALQLWTCNGTAAQVFRLDDVGSGYSRIVNTSSGKCVDISGSSTADGTRVQIWTCNGTRAQSWKLAGIGGTVDAGAPDTSAPDTSAPDTSVPETSVPETGAPDANASDTGNGDPYAAVRQACVDHINSLRATVGLGPLARWTDNESCADGQCKSDSETGQAHGAFGQCPNWGQCECPGWGKVSDIVPGCLDAMWAEGPGGGHYDIMTSKTYTKVSCGFYVMPTGKVWAVQDYR